MTLQVSLHPGNEMSAKNDGFCAGLPRPEQQPGTSENNGIPHERTVLATGCGPSRGLGRSAIVGQLESADGRPGRPQLLHAPGLGHHTAVDSDDRCGHRKATIAGREPMRTLLAAALAAVIVLPAAADDRREAFYAFFQAVDAK